MLIERVEQLNDVGDILRELVGGTVTTDHDILRHLSSPDDSALWPDLRTRRPYKSPQAGMLPTGRRCWGGLAIDQVRYASKQLGIVNYVENPAPSVLTAGAVWSRDRTLLIHVTKN
jgi:hypothetical protein